MDFFPLLMSAQAYGLFPIDDGLGHSSAYIVLMCE